MTNRNDLKKSDRFKGVSVNEKLTLGRSKRLFEARRSVKSNRLLGSWSSDRESWIKAISAVSLVGMTLTDRFVRENLKLILILTRLTTPPMVNGRKSKSRQR